MVHIVPFSGIDDNYEGKKILREDSCGKQTVAVLYNGATMIALCKDCLGIIKTDMNNIE